MTQPFVLLEVSHDGSGDTGGLRALALRAARLLGCDEVDSTRVATSVSELARLARPGLAVRVRFTVAASTFAVTFGFSGAHTALTPAVRTSVTRLMDSVYVTDDEVIIGRELARPWDEIELAGVRDVLLREASIDSGALLQSINEELVTALIQLREREAELVRLNAELDQTNRSVIGLYAELERRSVEVRAAQREVFQELADALRPPAPAVEGVELAVSYLPAQANSPTGGDLYDWLPLADGTLHLTVVDVQGHGVLSTRDALHVTHTVRTLALDARPLDQLLAHTHDLVCSAAQPVTATALVAQFDATSGVLRLAGAGHPPALRVSVNGVATYLEAPGRPIGYEGAGSRLESVTTLDPGDTVLLYTDGLIEVRRDIIEGMDRLARAVTESRHLPLASLLSTAVALCSDGVEFTDDTLLLGLRWPGPAAP